MRILNFNFREGASFFIHVWVIHIDQEKYREADLNHKDDHGFSEESLQLYQGESVGFDIGHDGVAVDVIVKLYSLNRL